LGAHEDEVISMVFLRVNAQLLPVIVVCMLVMIAGMPNPAGVAAGVTAGVKIGVCVANQRVAFESDDYPTRSREGITLGGYVELPLRRGLHVLAEFEYVQKGMRDQWFEITPGGEEIRGPWLDNRVDYLSIPVLIKYVVPVGDFRPFVSAGPRVDIRIGSRCQPDPFGPIVWDYIYDDLERIDFGADAALGIDTPWLSLEGRYNYAFQPSFRSGFITVRNRSYQVLVGRRI
jgi:hypothetical protein